MAGRWLDVGEAAREMGISTDAVRKRMARGTLPSDRRDGRVVVWLDDGGRSRDDAPRPSERRDLVEELRDRIASLERRLDEERGFRRKADEIIAQLARANAAPTARAPELEGHASGWAPSRGFSEEGLELFAGGAASGPPTLADGRQPSNRSGEPWYRRWFGG